MDLPWMIDLFSGLSLKVLSSNILKTSPNITTTKSVACNTDQLLKTINDYDFEKVEDSLQQILECGKRINKAVFFEPNMNAERTQQFIDAVDCCMKQGCRSVALFHAGEHDDDDGIVDAVEKLRTTDKGRNCDFLMVFCSYGISPRLEITTS